MFKRVLAFFSGAQSVVPSCTSQRWLTSRRASLMVTRVRQRG